MMSWLSDAVSVVKHPWDPEGPSLQDPSKQCGKNFVWMMFDRCLRRPWLWVLPLHGPKHRSREGGGSPPSASLEHKLGKKVM